MKIIVLKKNEHLSSLLFFKHAEFMIKCIVYYNYNIKRFLFKFMNLSFYY